MFTDEAIADGYIIIELENFNYKIDSISEKNMINRIEPLEKLPDFARNYNIKTDLREIDVDIEEIERNKEKRIREEQEQVNKVFGGNNGPN